MLMIDHDGRMTDIQAAMSSGVVDVCLIPEVPFSLDKLCDYVQSVMEKKVHMPR